MFKEKLQKNSVLHKSLTFSVFLGMGEDCIRALDFTSYQIDKSSGDRFNKSPFSETL